MNLDAFIQLVPADQQAKCRQDTLELWCHMYAYIEQTGYADTADDEDFVRHVHQHKSLATSSIASNLRKMANCGLIVGHKMRLVPGNRNQFDIFPLLGDTLPSHLIRYTLPGQKPPTHMKRAQKAQAQMTKLAADYRQKQEQGPKEIKTLSDIGDLRHWLAEKSEKKETISSEQNERLQGLVAEASKLLREVDRDIQKFYIGTALRSSLEPGV